MGKNYLIKCFFSFLLLCALGNQGVGAQPSAKNKMLHYSTHQGLSYGVVNSITQDNRGFMWFATGDGLNRFDGSNFKVFKFDPANPASISSNYVQQVFKDSDGILWASSRRGLNRFDPKQEQFITYRFTAKGMEDDVSNISESRDGNLWISSSSNGFYYFDKNKITYRRYHTESLRELKENSILNVLEDHQGWIWVGTKDAGLQVFKRGADQKLSLLPFAIPFNNGNRVHHVFEDSMGNVWVATSKGLLYYNRKENTFHRLSVDSEGIQYPYLSVIENANQEILVGVQNKGLYSVELRRLSKSQPEKAPFEPIGRDQDYQIREQSVQALFLDRDENIWLGTHGDGLFMLSSMQDRFIRFQQKREKPIGDRNVSYYGMTLDSDGNLWLGTDGAGIYKTSRTGKLLKHYSASHAPGRLKDNAILSAYTDRENRLWFGSYSKGLFRYTPESDSFIHYPANPADSASLKSNDVRVIYQDRKLNLWVGTNGGGLSLFNPKEEHFSSIVFKNGNFIDDIRSIVEDKQGNLWIGGYGGGLNYFNVQTRSLTKVLNSENNQNILSNNVVFSLFLDKKERLWIGTEGDGLLIYDTQNESTQVFNESNGLANSTIYAIQEDGHGKIWLSTNKGVSKVDPFDFSIHNFDESDGLQPGSFNAGAVVYDPKLQFMVFGGTEGWNLFYPQEIETLSDYRPEVLITGLQLFAKRPNQADNWSRLDKDLSEYNEITLKPNLSFSIHYVALNFTYPKEGTFAYMLEGLDRDWVYVKDQQQATYRYLDPGTYTFKVKASNQDLQWTEDYKSLRIKILPPWYKTGWAYLIYVVLLCLATRSYIQHKVKQRRLKYKLKVSQLKALKEKELHEKMLSFFTNISHEFRSPLTLIISPVKELLSDKKAKEVQHTMNVVYRNSKRLLNLVDQLLWFGKEKEVEEILVVKQINLSSLCKEVFLCYLHEAKNKDIQYQFLGGEESVEIYGDPDKLEIALFNLLSNAFKFTPEGGSIRLEIETLDEQVLLRVSDTGLGIPKDIGDRVFDRFYQGRANQQNGQVGFGIGLYLVKSIVHRHGAKLNYHSRIGKGTEFEISFKKGNLHFDSQLFVEPSQKEVFLQEKPLEDFSYPLVPVQGDSSLMQSELSTDKLTLLVIDDHLDIRKYIASIFIKNFNVIEADNGKQGFELIKAYLPDVVISDVMMPGLNGIELCQKVKSDEGLNHISVILLTASSSSEIKFQGIELGADDYIHKPFDKNLLHARVMGILKSRNNLQRYFYNEITLKPNYLKISSEDKAFLDRCLQIVEENLEKTSFGVKDLMEEFCMSRSSLYYKIKSLSGQSPNEFIRFIRLRKAAQLLISSEATIYEISAKVGMKDPKYFREQFRKVFEMNPSEFIRKYRTPFVDQYPLNKEIVDSKGK